MDPRANWRYRYRVGTDHTEPILCRVGGCGVLVSPDRGLARKSGMGWLGMLLASVEAVEAVHRHDPDQHELPDLAQQIDWGAPGVCGVDVAAGDRQEILGFDTGDITNMRGRAAHLPGAQRILGQVVAHTGLEVQVGPQLAWRPRVPLA